MIFKEEDGTFLQWDERGDEIKVTRYVPRNLTLARENHELRKDPGNGFSADREWRLVGRIDPHAFKAASQVDPALMADDTEEGQKALRKFLKMNEDARTVAKGL